MFLLTFSCLLAPAASAAVPPAQAPVWQKGDTWAVGSDFDWGSDLAGAIRNVTGEAGLGLGVSIDRFDFGANGSSWIVFKVTDANASEYKLNGKLALRLNADAHLELTGPMKDPGTYTITSFASAPTHARTLQLDAVVDIAFIVDTNTVFENGTLAIKTCDIEILGSAMASLDIVNFPDLKYDTPNSSVTLNYLTYNFDLQFDMDATFHIAFDPWLDIFHFPINVGESWITNSTVTVSGEMTGTLNVNGLPVSLEQMLFANEPLQQLGITSFPIDFSHVSWTGPPTVMNGVLQPMSGSISLEMQCTEATNLLLPYYGNIVVYKISLHGGDAYIYYSDDIHFLAQMDATMPALSGMPPELSDLKTGMEPVAPATAEQKVASIATYESTLLSGGSSGTSAGIDPMIAIVIGIVLVVAGVAILALLIMRRRRL